MPDKNAVHRAAAALRTALVGKQIVGFEAEKLSGPMPRLGRTVEDVVSHGRHLEICWDDDIVLHTNLGWRGSWELYRRGETWRKPQHMARVVVETIDWVAVCFKARDVETYRPDSFDRHPNFGRLGPDLHDANADINECVRRLMTYENPTIAIADVLLDQHVATGIGNVYRCEVLWSSEVHPLAPVGLLPQSTCVEIVRTACALLQQQNAESSSDLFAYGRNGQPCKRCGGVIALRYHGSPARLLYWCPSCQLGCAPAPDSDISDPIARLTDPHPAGSMYISEMVQNHGLFSDNGNQAAS